jgi:regulatory protein YycH of two-component signal transduction system YycFG
MPTSRQLNNNQKQHLMSTAHQNVLIETIKNKNMSAAQNNLKAREHSRTGNQQSNCRLNG